MIGQFDPQSGKISWRRSYQYQTARAALDAQLNQMREIEAAREQQQKERDRDLAVLAAQANAKRRAALARSKKLRIRGPHSDARPLHTEHNRWFWCYDPSIPDMKSYGTTPDEALRGHLDLVSSIQHWENQQ